ncbi:MAG: family 10 glycosylhydrolase [Candidatus Aureabacteria bacterium]|nr:family 10 glycosylhydrolase [Candidatus Auribacterota bacterium]
MPLFLLQSKLYLLSCPGFSQKTGRCVKIILFLLFFSLFLTSAEATEIPLSIWVECEGSNKTLSSEQKIAEMVDFCSDAGISEIFVQIYRGNRAWFRTVLAGEGLVDDTPYREFLEKEKGLDLLAAVIKKAHEKNIKVHGWINTFRIAKNLKAPVLLKYGKDIIIVDSKNRSMLDYPDLNLPGPEGEFFSTGGDGYWLNPGDNRVRSLIAGLIQGIIKEYPDIDGVHLDFVRYPYCVPYSPGSLWMKGVDFGYNKANRERFSDAYGLDPLHMDRNRANCGLWDDFRRDLISGFVKEQGLAVRKSGKKFSAAVLCWPDRAYLSSFQDWRMWMEDDYLDFIVVMNYGTDRRLVRYLSKEAMAFRRGAGVYIGLGAYLLKQNPDGLKEQMSDTEDISPDGITLFSYDSIKDQPRITDVIRGLN